MESCIFLTQLSKQIIPEHVWLPVALKGRQGYNARNVNFALKLGLTTSQVGS